MLSAASFAQREAERLASLTFFLDHQIGRYVVAEALRAASAHVEVHLDYFPGDKPDLEWIPEVGKRDWVLITKDQGIRRNPLERAAYEAALTARSWVTHHRVKARRTSLALAVSGQRLSSPVSPVSLFVRGGVWRDTSRIVESDPFTPSYPHFCPFSGSSFGPMHPLR